MKDAGCETFKQYVKAGVKQCNGLTNWLDFHNLLPSPVAADAAQGAVIGEGDSFYIARNVLPRKVNRNGTDGSMGLARLIAMRHAGLLPTPIATDWKGGTDRDRKSGEPRNDSLRHLFKRIEKRGADGLPDRQKPLAELLLTPRATDGLRSGMPGKTLVRHNHKNAEKSNLAEQIAHKTGGGNFHLNPLFVEEMMGFPRGWTIFPFLRESGDGRQ